MARRAKPEHTNARHARHRRRMAGPSRMVGPRAGSGHAQLDVAKAGNMVHGPLRRQFGLARVSPLVLCTAMLLACSACLGSARATCLISPVAPPVWRSGSPHCPQGFYCPNLNVSDESTWPSVCMPTPGCARQRLMGSFCASQGTYEPTVCKEGYYCPSAHEQIECPAGSFCPIGSSAPFQCSILSACPAGSTRERFYGALVILAAVDATLAAIVWALRRRGRTRSQSAAERHERHIREQAARFTAAPAAMPANVRDRAQHASAMLETISLACSGAGERSGASYEGAPDDASGSLSMRVDFEDLSLRLPNGKVLLSGVTGGFAPGRLTAIMGPTGAGKTALLRTILGKLDATGGTVRVNGRRTPLRMFRKLIGFVPQDDVMHADVLVREAILHSARVRLPADFSEARVEAHVRTVIGALGLEWVRGTRVGDEVKRGVSGGERKRCNIGIELAGAPVFLGLDEPTSGLDTTSALHVCQTLKDIAALGLTVVAVVHQPRREIFELFDDCILLQPGGVAVYAGEADGAVGHMQDLGFEYDERTNPADFLLDALVGHAKKHPQGESAAAAVEAKGEARMESMPLLAVVPSSTSSGGLDKQRRQRRPNCTSGCGAWVADVARDVQQSCCCGTRESQEASSGGLRLQRSTASVLRQTLWAHNRSIVLQYRNAGTLAVEAFLAGIAGLLMGLTSHGKPLYRGLLHGDWSLISPAPNEQGVPLMCFFILLAMGVAASPPGVHVFADDLPVYWREVSAGHSRLALFLGKAVASIYRTTIACLHFACFLYFLAAPRGAFWRYAAAMWSAGFYVYGLGSLIGVVAGKANAALTAVIVAMALAATCGFSPTLENVKDWGVWPVWQLLPAPWGAEAVYTTMIEPWGNIYDVDASASGYGYEFGRFGLDCGAMVAFGVACRVGALAMLVLLNRDHQR